MKKIVGKLTGEELFSAEWRDVIAAEKREHDPRSITAREFGQATGLCEGIAKARLEAMVEAGKATRAHKRVRQGERTNWAVSYRLVKK